MCQNKNTKTMPKNHFNNITLTDLKILSDFKDGMNLKKISSTEKINPKDIIISVRRSFRNLTQAVNFKGKQTGFLLISKSDAQSLYDSSNILYRLKIIRTAMGYSISEFSEKIGISRQTYSLLENGDIELTVKYIDKIIDLFEHGFKKYIDYLIGQYKATNFWSSGSEDYNNFSDVLSWFEYYEFASDGEKKLLHSKAKLDDQRINIQIILCLRLIAYLPKLAETETEINKKVMSKDLSEKEKKNLSKSFNVIRNQKNHVTDLRNFIIENFKRKDFKVDDSYLNELLFLPALMLNKKILNNALEMVKNKLF